MPFDIGEDPSRVLSLILPANEVMVIHVRLPSTGFRGSEEGLLNQDNELTQSGTTFIGSQYKGL